MTAFVLLLAYAAACVIGGYVWGNISGYSDGWDRGYKSADEVWQKKTHP